MSPVSQLVAHLPHSVPQILINRDAVTHANFDIVLLGDADIIVQHICSKLGPEWDLGRVPVQHSSNLETNTAPQTSPGGDAVHERIGESWVTLFEGATRGAWVDAVERAFSGEDSEEPQETADHHAQTRLQIPASQPGSRSRSRSPTGEQDVERKRANLNM